MVIYEVNLHARPEIAVAFSDWLKSHVDEMLTLPGFVRADMFECESDEPGVQYVVHYILESRQALESYFQDHAERMRSDGLERFGSQFQATRRILLPVVPSSR